MLLDVECGGFFSSSASGYSKGLMHLLLGQKNEERPMRVSPCNQCLLADQEGDPDLQLASRKNRLSRGCTSLICFCRASRGANGPLSSKRGPLIQAETLPDSSHASDSGKFCTTNDITYVTARNFRLKSNLKKQPRDFYVVGEGDNTHHPIEAQNNDSGCTERRKVQWTDACGGELAEIREFEGSDKDEPDDIFEFEGDRRCECVIQ